MLGVEHVEQQVDRFAPRSLDETAFDVADGPDADTGPVGQFLLGQAPLDAQVPERLLVQRRFNPSVTEWTRGQSDQNWRTR
ncbi:hypothetical protein ACFQ9X_08765 [Catenulispora yoronensis]